ncbi:YcnI family copper-binding membrane protein [Neobacillus jeddahensis]|uniref:YcnI family copper-binding membrane protein n=1 Tax=Neobacillus jeddahensis TaxID=1461580 RepID=UPI00058D632F|nr:YcnI family protein [Neobacillus jeddahensis]
MKKIFTFMLSMIGALTIFAGAASAHVTVQPNETSQGKYEVFTVKVPSENEQVPTTKIEVKIPEDVDVTRFEPKPGWKYELQKDESGKITSVTWTAEGEGLSPTEFTMFNMSGKVGDNAEKIVWKAYQTYEDGSVVEWVGAEDAEKPASVTVVHPASSSETGHGHEAVQTDNTTDASTDTNQNAEDAASSNISLYLAIAALLAAIIALGISLKKK